MISVAGNTYVIRDSLKGAGGRWNPDRKAWEFDDDRTEGLVEVLKIVAKGVRGVRVYQDGKEVPLSDAGCQMSLF